MPQRIGIALVALLSIALFVVGSLFRSSVATPRTEAVELVFDEPRNYVCQRAESAIRIDGKLDESAWQAADWSKDFVDIEGAIRPKPLYRTRVKMLWDDTHLYIAAELEEPHVWANATEHDSYIFHFDNDFEVFLDPDGDNHLYAELEMNARNTTWDLLLVKPYQAGGPAIDAWEIVGLKSAVHVDGTLNDSRDRDRGWTIEMAWPWSALRQIAGRPVPPKDGDQWRINFSRVQWQHEIVDGKYRKAANTKEDNWVWSPQGVIDMHRPERWGYVQFTATPAGMTAPPFRLDPSAPARELLHRLYWAQKDYHRQHGRYADTLATLRLPRYIHPALGEPEMIASATSFEITVPVRTQGIEERWQIRSDGRISKAK